MNDVLLNRHDNKRVRENAKRDWQTSPGSSCLIYAAVTYPGGHANPLLPYFAVQARALVLVQFGLDLVSD